MLRYDNIARFEDGEVLILDRRIYPAKKEFVRCEQSSRDRRFKCVFTTEKARGLKGEVARVERETFDWLTRGLAPAQVEELLAITDVMLENVWAGCRKGCEESDD